MPKRLHALILIFIYATAAGAGARNPLATLAMCSTLLEGPEFNLENLAHQDVLQELAPDVYALKGAKILVAEIESLRRLSGA